MEILQKLHWTGIHRVPEELVVSKKREKNRRQWSESSRQAVIGSEGARREQNSMICRWSMLPRGVRFLDDHY